ncbi:MAG: hypothetical protein B9S32_14680 [Verrucomicrobia bacterium Tous-C9LFEB]|nr:MAG: hypothetical protein B9S32_14680 [Verrucomicrobia bacterium Tous-C9LFEB]
MTLTAQASLLLYDGFDYASGTLTGSNGGAGFSSTWLTSGAGGTTVATPGYTYTDTLGNELQTAGGYVSISGTSSGGAYRNFSAITAAAGTTTSYWVSVLMDTTGAPYGASSDTSIIQLRTSGFANLVSVGAFGTNASFRMRAVSGDAATTIYSTTSGVANSSNLSLIVLRIDVNTLSNGADAIYMWVNPDLNAEPSTGSAAAAITGTNFWNDGEFSLTNIRAGVENAGTAEAKGLNLDEFRMGTDYASVLVSIPEPAHLALWSTSALIMGIYLRRRRYSL